MPECVVQEFPRGCPKLHELEYDTCSSSESDMVVTISSKLSRKDWHPLVCYKDKDENILEKFLFFSSSGYKRRKKEALSSKAMKQHLLMISSNYNKDVNFPTLFHLSISMGTNTPFPSHPTQTLYSNILQMVFLYLRHQSSKGKAYDTLRQGGIELPSQHPLREYTCCCKGLTRFSNCVDQQRVLSSKALTCEEWQSTCMLFFYLMRCISGTW